MNLKKEDFILVRTFEDKEVLVLPKGFFDDKEPTPQDIAEEVIEEVVKEIVEEAIPEPTPEELEIAKHLKMEAELAEIEKHEKIEKLEKELAEAKGE